MSFSLKKVCIALIVLFVSFLAGTYIVFAQNSTLSKITYPVIELGNCASQQECKTYCSIASNYSKCAAFAQKVGLVIEVPDDKKGVFTAMQKGESPGGCKDEASCRKYCESTDTDNIKECLAFAEKFNLVSADELKEMRQMAAVKQSGAKFPGNCKTKESCLAYCENPTRQVECMEFAIKAGFISKEDAEAATKILPYLKSGGKFPGGCTSKESCESYCASDTHTNECIDFQVKVGFMTKEEAEKNTKEKREFMASLEKAPPEWFACMEKELGSSFFGRFKAGKLTGSEAKSSALETAQRKCEGLMGPSAGGPLGAVECVKQGGSWDGNQCDFSKKGGGITDPGECSKQGGAWDGTKCDFSKKGVGDLGAVECVKQGGALNGKLCDFSKKGAGITDAGECSKQGGAWDGKQCNFSKKGVGDLGAAECVKQGGILNGKLCDFSKKGGGINNAGECSKQGGSWNGKQCDFSKKGGGINNAGECSRQGGTWDGKQCKGARAVGDQGAVECAKQGGIPNGKQCDFSKKGGGSLDSGECAKQGGAWDGKQCDFSKKGVKPQTPQKYPLLPQPSFLGAILRYFFK